MNNSITILVGLVGSGKSKYAEYLSNVYRNVVVVESDAYRERVYGDSSIQGNNHLLFEEIHRDINLYLSEEKNVIFDATNISRKHRKALLDKIPSGVVKECIIVATEYEKCIAQNKSRDRFVPELVIDRMYKSFQMPTFTEGFEVIDIVYNYERDNYNIDEYLKFADSYDQKNYHHSLTLGEHSRKVAKTLENQSVPEHVRLAGLLHDCGKPATQVFTNLKGEPSNIAHYYNHENCGAYDSLFYLDKFNFSIKELVEATSLVNYHMRPYMAKTEKAEDKIKEIMGDSYRWLKLLHEADIEAH